MDVEGGTLGGNSASGSWIFGSLNQAGGTIDATSATIIINSEIRTSTRLKPKLFFEKQLYITIEIVLYDY